MSKLFGATPKPPKPVPMVDEAAVKRARQRAAMSMRSSGGRESTILGSVTGTTDKLGG